MTFIKSWGENICMLNKNRIIFEDNAKKKKKGFRPIYVHAPVPGKRGGHVTREKA